MGWLSAKPGDSDETRAQMYGERLPELPWQERLPDYWREMGFASIAVSATGVGFVPFTWQEVAAFISASGFDISPVETRVLVEMSRAYSRHYGDTNPLSIEPMERVSDD